MVVGAGETGGEASSELERVYLQFRARGGQLYAAFNALQVLSDWAGADLVADVNIFATADTPLDKNLYETAVVMA